MAKIVAPKSPSRLPKSVQAYQLEDLFRHLGERDPESEKLPGFSHLRDRLAMEVLYSCGLRRAELIGLRDIDVNLNKAYLRVIGKGNKERIIPLSKRLAQLLQEYQSKRQDCFGESGEGYLLLTDKGGETLSQIRLPLGSGLLIFSKYRRAKESSCFAAQLCHAPGRFGC